MKFRANLGGGIGGVIESIPEYPSRWVDLSGAFTFFANQRRWRRAVWPSVLYWPWRVARSVSWWSCWLMFVEWWPLVFVSLMVFRGVMVALSWGWRATHRTPAAHAFWQGPSS